MASIKIKVSRGGYTASGFASKSGGNPDEIEIDVPIPDRASNFVSEYLALVGVTFDKTSELVDVVRGQGQIVDAEIADDEEVSA